MPSGGYRPNAGRKKKPVGEKLLEGKKGENFEKILYTALFGSSSMFL